MFILIVSDQREHCTEETSGLWQVQHQQVGTISDLKFHILPSDIFYIHFPFILWEEHGKSKTNLCSSFFPLSTFPR